MPGEDRASDEEAESATSEPAEAGSAPRPIATSRERPAARHSDACKVLFANARIPPPVSLLPASRNRLSARLSAGVANSISS